MSDFRLGHYRFDTKELFTIPNILCYIRILLVPAFVSLYLVGMYSSSESQRIWLECLGLGAVALASLCDLFDGKIARHFNMITEIGKFLDPLADKIMQCSIAVVACIGFQHITGLNYMWVLLAFFIIKEVVQFLVIFIDFNHGCYIDGAKWYGKAATFGFDVLMIAMLILPIFHPTAEEGSAEFVAMIVMIFTSFLLLLFSFVMYMIACFRLYKSNVNNIPDSMYAGWLAKNGNKPRAIKKPADYVIKDDKNEDGKKGS